MQAVYSRLITAKRRLNSVDYATQALIGYTKIALQQGVSVFRDAEHLQHRRIVVEALKVGDERFSALSVGVVTILIEDHLGQGREIKSSKASKINAEISLWKQQDSAVRRELAPLRTLSQ